MRIQLLSFQLALVILLVGNNSFCQNVAAGSKDELLFSVGNEKVTVSEFEQLYSHNPSMQDKKDTAKSSYADFLKMIIDYKLKLQEAYRNKLNKDKEIISELKSYRKNIASIYVLNKELVDPAIKKLYKHKKMNVNAAHILINFGKGNDTSVAYEKSMEIIQRLKKGESFDSLAMKYSQDTTNAKIGGKMNVFVSGTMFPAFEDACYDTPIGKFTETPVHGKAGYHIIKILGTTIAPPLRHVAHILLTYTDAKDSLKQKMLADSLYDCLKKGSDFGEFARKFSQHKMSARYGGEVGFVTHGQVPIEVDSIIFSIPLGTVAPPVKTRFGFDIVKVIEERPLGSFEENREELKRIYKGTRFNKEYAGFIQKLKASYHPIVDANFEKLIAAPTDSTLTPEEIKWDSVYSSSRRKKIIFSVADRKYPLDSLINFLKTSDEFHDQMLTKKNLRNGEYRFQETVLIDYYTRNLEKEDPEFNRMMHDYLEGLMIFKLERANVWEKVKIDDQQLHSYYNDHHSEFRWNDRVDFGDISVGKDSVARKLYDSLKAGAIFDSLAFHNTRTPGMKEKCGKWGLIDYKENDLSKIASAMAIDSICPPIKTKYGYSIIKVFKKEASREKTYEEALSELSTRYQDEVTTKIGNEWVASLRKKTSPQINEQVFKTHFEK